MKLKKATLPWTTKQYKKMNDKGLLDFRIAVQRGEVWNDERKSLLIHSILQGYPIPSFYAVKDGDIFRFLDGKQRLGGAVFAYLDDKYALHANTPDVIDDDNNIHKVAGLKFSELPQDLQMDFLGYTFNVTYFDDVTDEEIEEIFFRLNNGVALTNIEKTRVQIGNKIMMYINDVANKSFMLKVRDNLTASALKRYTDQEIVFHMLMLLEDENTGLSSKEMHNYALKFKGDDVPTTTKEMLEKTLAYMDSAFIAGDKFIKKVNVPIIFKVATQAMADGIKPLSFGIKIREFFQEQNAESDYSQACRVSSASKNAVNTRLSIMTEYYNKVKSSVA